MPQSITRHHVVEAIEEAIGYSQVVRAGQFLFIAGLTAAQPDMTVAHSRSMEGQLREIYDRLGAILAIHGLTLEHVVEEVVYTRSMDDFMPLTEVRKSFFPTAAYPASTAVQVEKFALPDILIEIRFTAYVGSSQ